MNWDQLKDELREAVKENITVTMSPHTVLAIMQQVEDQQLLIEDFDRAVSKWMAIDNEENWPMILNSVMVIQEHIRTLFKTTKPYEPDKKKFAEYVEWRRSNPTGTYADFRND